MSWGSLARKKTVPLCSEKVRWQVLQQRSRCWRCFPKRSWTERFPALRWPKAEHWALGQPKRAKSSIGTRHPGWSRKAGQHTLGCEAEPCYVNPFFLGHHPMAKREVIQSVAVGSVGTNEMVIVRQVHDIEATVCEA